MTTSPNDVEGCDLIVEAIVEDAEAKAAMLAALGEICPTADLATTTSSLGIAELGERAGIADRFYGLHVFNPVPRMELIELCIPGALPPEIGARARAFCGALRKHVVEVPDEAGFVVNRLLFPYLFDAVRLLDELGLEPIEVDACMSKGAGQPMGPLQLLDFVGLDVSVAIGEKLHAASGSKGHAPPRAAHRHGRCRQARPQERHRLLRLLNNLDLHASRPATPNGPREGRSPGTQRSNSLGVI